MSQNILYDNARNLFATAQLDFSEAGKIWCLLVNNGYTYNASHSMLSDISGTAGGPRDYSTTGNTANFAGYELQNNDVDPNGACKGDPVRFLTVPAALAPANAIVLYYKGVNEANSPLIYYAGIATGLPIPPNGGDIIVTWSTGTNKIFRP